MKQIIIRTPDGKPVDTAVEDRIKEFAGLSSNAEVAIKYQSSYDQELFAYSYAERINAVTDAAKLLTKVLPQDCFGEINRDDFPDCLTQLNQIYLDKINANKNINDIASYQEILEEYLKRLEYTLKTKLNLKDKDIRKQLGSGKALSVGKLLCKADEYAALQQGRPILATVDYVSSSSGDYLIQVETPQDPLSDRKKNEFADAKNKAKKLQEKPEWFQKLTYIEQKLFETALENKSDKKVELDAISSKLRTIPGVAHFSRHKMAIVNKTGVIKKEFASRLRSSMIAARDMITKGKKLRDEYARHNLIQIVKNDLEHKLATGEVSLEDIDKIPILVQTLISPLPLPARIARLINPDNDLYIDKQRAIEYLKQNGVELNLPGITVHVKPKNIISTNHPLNPARYLTPAAGKFGSYKGSPSTVAGYQLIKLANEFIINAPDKAKITKLRKKIDAANDIESILLLEDEIRRFEKNIQLASTIHKNIPKNLADSDSLQANKEYLNSRLNAAYKEVDNRNELLAQASKELNTLINDTAKGMESSNNRELFLSSLEEVITTTMHGTSYGSCVSGKDRKSLETIHTDAMLLYYEQEKALPKYNDTPENRNKFVEIYAKLYTTRHHQTNAGQNAPGANGIKTPYLYLPDDIQKAIINEYKKHEMNYSHSVLQDTSRLASNNELDKVLKKITGFFKKLTGKQKKQYDDEFENYLNSKSTKQSEGTIAVDLTGRDKSQAKDLLKKVVNENAGDVPTPNTKISKIESQLLHSELLSIISTLRGITGHEHWDKLGNFDPPVGVKQMREYLLQTPINSNNPATTLAALADIAEKRFANSPNNKYPDTYALYKAIIKLNELVTKDNAADPLTVNKLQASIPYKIMTTLNERIMQSEDKKPGISFGT